MIADGEYVPPIIDIPKTDKEKRHEKRLKQMKKEERKKARDKKEDLQIVATDFPQAVNHLSEEELEDCFLSTSKLVANIKKSKYSGDESWSRNHD